MDAKQKDWNQDKKANRGGSFTAFKNSLFAFKYPVYSLWHSLFRSGSRGRCFHVLSLMWMCLMDVVMFNLWMGYLHLWHIGKTTKIHQSPRWISLSVTQRPSYTIICWAFWCLPFFCVIWKRHTAGKGGWLITVHCVPWNILSHLDSGRVGLMVRVATGPQTAECCLLDANLSNAVGLSVSIWVLIVSIPRSRIDTSVMKSILLLQFLFNT